MTYVQVREVGPRDGLQNDPTQTTPEVRAELCKRLADAGLPLVEAVSFVNDKRVPRMAQAERVIELLPKDTKTKFVGLVLNERGYDRAVASGVECVQYGFPVTDKFNARNQGSTVADSVALAKRIVERARSDGKHITISLSVVFGCPFEGRVDPGHVLAIAEEVAATKPDCLSLADSIGVAVPAQIRDVVGRTVKLGIPVSCHFHNTRNTAIANALAAIESGATRLDASVGGTGGCPFAPGSTGNVATEDLVYMLHGMGFETGIDLDKLISVAKWLEEQLGHPIPSALMRAGPFKLIA